MWGNKGTYEVDLNPSNKGVHALEKLISWIDPIRLMAMCAPALHVENMIVGDDERCGAKHL